jgi:hypothetical protein
VKGRAFYVLGAPGSGKSSVVRALLAEAEPVAVELPVPHLVYEDGWVELGRRRETFSGTDALGMAIMPKAIEWVRSDGAPGLLIGEGARLGSAKFLSVVAEEYGRLDVIHLGGDPLVAYRRMVDRAASLGVDPQNERWWRGRVSAARNAARAMGAVEVDAGQSFEDVSAQVRELVRG